MQVLSTLVAGCYSFSPQLRSSHPTHPVIVHAQ